MPQKRKEPAVPILIRLFKLLQIFKLNYWFQKPLYLSRQSRNIDMKQKSFKKNMLVGFPSYAWHKLLLMGVRVLDEFLIGRIFFSACTVLLSSFYSNINENSLRKNTGYLFFYLKVLLSYLNTVIS